MGGNHQLVAVDGNHLDLRIADGKYQHLRNQDDSEWSKAGY